MGQALGLTRALARYAVQTDYEALPEAVRHEGARALLNWTGVAIGGSAEAAPAAAARTVAGRLPGDQTSRGELTGGGATVIGQGFRADVAGAAFVNCVASSVLAYDDAHLPTVAHPSGPAAAALVALAQTRPIDGRAFVNALALGIELQCRIATALVRPPGAINPSFYVNGFSGPIGVAAAVGRAIGLDEERMTWALGLAASQASGFRSTHGTMTAHFRPGHAAQVGVVSALLAENGFDCTTDALEAPGGFFDVYAPGSDLGLPLEALGERHDMLDNRYKPYPCGIVIHPVIDACQAIRARLPSRPAIVDVELIVNPLVVRLTGKRAPQTALESHVSVFHWAAVSLFSDAPGLAATRADCFRDPVVLALGARIRATARPETGKGEAEVRVTLADGQVLKERVLHARGSQERPMTDAELDAKFIAVTSGLAEERAAALQQACWRVAEAPDVGADVGALLP